MHYLFRLSGFLLFFLASCTHQPIRFERLTTEQTGIDFANTITETDSLNVLEFEYMFNGGGVGIGDFNGDGLSDVFFAGNQVSSRLYLNKGDFKFEDITRQAGVGTKFWCTGVAVADINQDGRQDIYVSTIHPDRNRVVPNLLFLNQGNNAAGTPQFKEVAREVGLADSSYSSQATFLDYDRDGDLDVFLLTNALEAYNRNNVTGPRNDGSAKSRDKLFRNDGQVVVYKAQGANSQANSPTPPGLLPHFTDVSEQAGLLHEGWGLGVVVNDVNQDGWPDIYVANDFQSNDVWLINNQNGTFSNKIAEALKHQSHNSMGMDIADINNDGLNDLAVVDMLPDDNLRQKTMFATIPYDRFQMARRLNYQPQYVRNVLQLNRGQGSGTMPLFSDISYLAGTAATDWSWSALFADLDNDGFRDLLITNGYRKDITDLDFISYNRDAGLFGTDAARRAQLLKRIEELEPVYKPNFLFHNKGDLHFANVANDWGMGEPSFTNGTAYADFDDDGDLDVVMNNINDPAFLYRNRTVDHSTDSTANRFLKINLIGKPGNREGLGAKVTIWAGGTMHYTEYTRQRGYLSTMESGIHVGLGHAQRIDSLKIVWPSGNAQILRNIRLSKVLTLDEQKAISPSASLPSKVPANSLLTEISAPLGLSFQHQEDDFVDYKAQQTLLSHKHSQIGPGLAVGDVDGNGLDDIYIAGAAHRGGTFFLQQIDPSGKNRFQRKDRPAKEPEETGVLLFDADLDGDLDLYAVHGSTEFGKNEARYQDSLYLNDGRGNFRSSATSLPNTTSSGSCIVATDFDHDGDLDLFVGGRIVPQRFPEPARSYLLRNDGLATRNSERGNNRSVPHFTDITDRFAPGLGQAGLICSALWTDIDNDTWPDLMLAGEFMPITVFKNDRGSRLTPLKMPTLEKAVGFWNSLTSGDFDNDGDLDYIAGNLGLNSRLQASASHPISVYAADYDKNGTLDPILSFFNGETEYPVHPRDVLTDQVPSFKKKMTSYASYGKMKLSDLLDNEQQKQAIHKQATYCSSAYIENRAGTLMLHELPIEAQFSTVFGTVANDLNHDGNLDILLTGNDFATEILSGWQDASLGLCLLGDGHGHFKPLSPAQSGFIVDGDAKSSASVLLANGQLYYFATQNNGPMRVFAETNGRARYERIKATDVSITPVKATGLKRKIEYSWGGGYLSQSSRVAEKKPY
ncbi:VCBS repeat-containing protein [Spirosoma aureum]|uniref:VCBS repeat-containing protein n=1 Tax=Spirosoma aureum TaxID=2692134 RepID=A0A6G9AFA8_9BACT|nr:VCBS repeat-containing protein [Spirosoma aureum]QIP11152.1 VCBS repeat-containing protein [Spirosoma aureum]